MLKDTCKGLSSSMLPIASDKAFIMQALAVCFIVPTFDQDPEIVHWRGFLATCYLQRDLTRDEMFAPEWQARQLQGSFTEVAQRIRDYGPAQLQPRKRARGP